MTIFTRGLLFIILLSCFYSCARRQQALYQFTPPNHVTQVAPSAAKQREIRPSFSDTTQVVDESLMASSTTELSKYRDQLKLKKEKVDQPAPIQSTTKTLTDPSKVDQVKRASYKPLLLKKRLGDTPQQTSGMAIASLVCGILAFFVLGVVLGPLAIIFGGVALSKIRKNPEVKGRGLAVAGLVLGIVATVLIIVILAAR